MIITESNIYTENNYNQMPTIKEFSVVEEYYSIMYEQEKLYGQIDQMIYSEIVQSLSEGDIANAVGAGSVIGGMSGAVLGLPVPIVGPPVLGLAGSIVGAVVGLVVGFVKSIIKLIRKMIQWVSSWFDKSKPDAKTIKNIERGKREHKALGSDRRVKEGYECKNSIIVKKTMMIELFTDAMDNIPEGTMDRAYMDSMKDKLIFRTVRYLGINIDSMIMTKNAALDIFTDSLKGNPVNIYDLYVDENDDVIKAGYNNEIKYLRELEKEIKATGDNLIKGAKKQFKYEATPSMKNYAVTVTKAIQSTMTAAIAAQLKVDKMALKQISDAEHYYAKLGASMA